MTVHSSLVAQVTWPGTQPSSTKSPASPHLSGPSRAPLESPGDQVHLEPLENKDPQVPQASQEMQECQEPQENEVSRVTPREGDSQSERDHGVYTVTDSEIKNKINFTLFTKFLICPETGTTKQHSFYQSISTV